MARQNQIIIPTMGLYQGRAKHLVPQQEIEGINATGIGLSYCRNVSLSRKQACIMKSRGIEKFTASATGATDSVRGIGVLNKYSRPDNYQGPNTTTKYVAANADDGRDDGTTWTNNSNDIAIGNSAGTVYNAAFRFPGWTIAQQIIQSAYLRLTISSVSGVALHKYKVYAEDVVDADQVADHADFATILANLTTWYKSYIVWGDDLAAGSVITIDVTHIIQELVTTSAYVNEAIQLVVKDDSNTTNHYIAVDAYDSGSDYASLEITHTDVYSSTPTFFMFVKGATAGELWKLDTERTPVEETQSGESYASLYQSQTAKFLQYGDDMLVTDDGVNDATQQWDTSDAAPKDFEDVAANYNGRYINEFRSRVWLWYPNISTTVYRQRGYYSDVNDQTTYSSFILLPGTDSPTAAINVTQDTQMVFKEGSAYRIIDMQTDASDYQPFLVSPNDGSLGANVISDGARLYGINEKGVFQWPVEGYPNGFRYISPPIQDEIDKIPITKMNLVWFAHSPADKLIYMHYPDTGSPRNNLCAEFNYEYNVWQNISDIYAGNVMIDAFHPDDGTPIMLWGEEDGHLKYIYGDDDDGSNFTGRFDTGAVFQLDSNNRLVSRRLIGIMPNSNYDGSMTLNFYYKGYDREDEESGASWNGPYTHDSTIEGNKEYVPINEIKEHQFHIIRVDGTVKDEAFEIYALGLEFDLGSR